MNFSNNQASLIEERAPKAEWSNLADAIFNPGSQQNQYFWNHFEKYWTNEEKAGILHKIPMQYKNLQFEQYVKKLRDHKEQRNAFIKKEPQKYKINKEMEELI